MFGGAQLSCAAARRRRCPSPSDPQRCILLSVPFFHATGCFAVLNPTVASGAKIVLMRKWDVELAMQLIEREKINSAGGVPTIAWQLIEHPEPRQIRSLVAGKRRLWRRAVGAGTGAEDQGDFPQIAARAMAGA